MRKALDRIEAGAPFHHMILPGGYRMSVAMTNCERLGWITDRRGCLDALDPHSGKPWPKMPAVFLELAERAAAEASYPGLVPDACLINRYEPGSRLSPSSGSQRGRLRRAHRLSSLGLPATFLFGGDQRSDRPKRVPIRHGDVAVWGGPSRLAFHGIAP